MTPTQQIQARPMVQPQGQPVLQERVANVEQPTLDLVGIVYILLSATGFGTVGVLAKLAYAHGLNPMSTQIWKLGGGAIILWGGLLAQTIWTGRRRTFGAKTGSATKRNRINGNVGASRPHYPPKVDTPMLKAGPEQDTHGMKQRAIAPFCLGAIGYAAFSMSLFGAFSYATVGVTLLLFYTYPAFAALLRWGLTRRPLTRWQAVCLGLTVAGCAITVDWQHQASSPWGLLLGVGAAIGYAAYLCGSANVVKANSPVESAAWMLSGATVTMIAIALWHHAWAIPENWVAFSAAMGLAIASTALPIVFLYAGLKRLDVVPVAILSTLEPVVAIALSVLFLAEPLWVGQIIGGGLILTSAIILQLRAS